MEIENKILYRIFVTTSNFQNAGTDSNVFIQLYGNEKSKRGTVSQLISVKFPLEKSLNHQKKFRPGQKDLFEIEETFVGSLKKIRISHDGKGVNSGWHLKKLVINAPDLNRSWKFICNKWLDALESKAECDLIPVRNSDHLELSSGEEDKNENDEIKTQARNQSGKIKKQRYNVKIQTSEFSKSTPEIKLNLKLIGADSESSLIKLNSTPSDKGKEKFLGGNADFFRLEENDIGMVDI